MLRAVYTEQRNISGISMPFLCLQIIYDKWSVDKWSNKVTLRNANTQHKQHLQRHRHRSPFCLLDATLLPSKHTVLCCGLVCARFLFFGANQELVWKKRFRHINRDRLRDWNTNYDFVFQRLLYFSLVVAFLFCSFFSITIPNDAKNELYEYSIWHYMFKSIEC